MVILTILAAVIVPKFVHRGEQAKLTAAKADIAAIGVGAGHLRDDMGRYPTSEEGLNACWCRARRRDRLARPYLKPGLSAKTPGATRTVYSAPGEHNAGGFDLYSFGPDGQEGGGDDIDNWTATS